MARKKPARQRRVVIVTGSRAEYGLLKPVMRAVMARKDLELRVVACGSHLLGEKPTVREVARDFPRPVLAAKVAMQSAVKGKALNVGRVRDAIAVGEGVSGLAKVFAKLEPEKGGWVVVLGDRIEAFAAASAASIGGWALAHIHGGDRAEGIADEAMRHAITKLAHLHLAATSESANRIVRMGEERERVVVVGSPAVDGLSDMGSSGAAKQKNPRVVVLLHPAGQSERVERESARKLAKSIAAHVERATGETGGAGEVLLLAPNHDAGREVIVEEWARASEAYGWMMVEHLPREKFVGVLRRLRENQGFFAGNSSAGLIECAAMGVAVLNVGPRQAGRERGRNVVDADALDDGVLGSKLRTVSRLAQMVSASDRFGDGHSGERIAAILADARWAVGEPAFFRKRNAY